MERKCRVKAAIAYFVIAAFLCDIVTVILSDFRYIIVKKQNNSCREQSEDKKERSCQYGCYEY